MEQVSAFTVKNRQCRDAARGSVFAIGEVIAVGVALLAIEHRMPGDALIQNGIGFINTATEVLREGGGRRRAFEERHHLAAGHVVAFKALRHALMADADRAEERDTLDARPEFIEVDDAVRGAFQGGFGVELEDFPERTLTCRRTRRK